jgi:hypothetical protein
LQIGAPKASTVRDALISISKDAEVLAFFNQFVPYERLESKIMKHQYFKEEEYDNLSQIDVNDEQAVKNCCDHFGFVTTVMAKQFIGLIQMITKKDDWKKSSFRSAMVGYAATINKQIQNPNDLKKKTARPFENCDGGLRTKFFLWMLLLNKYFSVEYAGCKEFATKLADSQLKAEGGEKERGDQFLAVYNCVSHIQLRSQMTIIRNRTWQNFGLSSDVILPVSLIADYCYSEESLGETQRFLSKLPACEGDIAQFYVIPEVYAFAHRKLPLDTPELNREDTKFLSRVFPTPVTALVAAFKGIVQGIIEENALTSNDDTETKKARKAEKRWINMMNREVTTAWMKIVNNVGFLVYPTTFTCPGG